MSRIKQKKKAGKETFILFLLFLLCAQLAQAQFIRHIGRSKGLSQLSVISIYQDQLGRMWFGTREGVSVYDGHSIVSYKAYAEDHTGRGDAVRIDNDINSIQGDKEGNIYLLAGYSLIKYDIRKDQFRCIIDQKVHAINSYQGRIWCMRDGDLCSYNSDNDSIELAMHINVAEPNCLTITNDKVYIGTKSGLYVTDRKEKNTRCLIPDVNVYRTFESSQKELWVGCRMKGLYRISRTGKVQKVPHLSGSAHGVSSTQIRDFCEDNQQNIWFGTFDGLQKCDYQSDTYSLIKPDKSVGGLNHPSIFAVYKDRQGAIWLGSYYGGVNYFNPEQEGLMRYNYDQNAVKDLYYSYIGEMVEDKEKNLWVSTDGGGISSIDPRTRLFTNYKAGVGNALPHNNIKSICYDEKRHQLYIGTYLGGLSRYDIKAGQFYNYLQNEVKGDAPGDIIFHTVFHNNRLYLSSNKGVFVLNPETNESRRIYSNVYCQNFDVDSEGGIWLLLWGAVVYINPRYPEDVKHINLKEYGCHFRPTKIKVTTEGIYIGTLGAGLYRYHPKLGKMENYTVKGGQLLSDYCYNIGITQLGNVIITGDKGITLFSPANQSFQSTELPSSFPAPAIINDCGVYVMSDGRICVGDIQGVTLFRENSLRMFSSKLGLYFSKLSVNDQSIYPDDGTNILTTSLPFVDELKLKHNQNNLTLYFAISNHSGMQQSSYYEYKLKGFDKQWITTKQMGLHYTNLDPGKYTLYIRTRSNGDNVEVEEIALPIYIAAPWYNSVWSWLIYLLVAILCITYFIRSRTARKILALSLEKEQFEKRQIEQMNHAKLLFFTNVSHEFRTPLTLIVSHIELLLQQANIPPVIYAPILKIHKNALQMKNLVSELLDFRKFEQNHVVLKVAEQNLVTFLREVYNSFSEYARQRNIRFNFISSSEEATCWFDTRQMEKVFYNLLSNAFKYTPDQGTIEISISNMEDCIQVQIKDSGTGIDASEATRIFDRFFQSSNQPKEMNSNPGTGIGLALTKSIVDKHHGEIRVESQKAKGSVFTVCLRKGKGSFASDKEVVLLGQAEENVSLFYSQPFGLELASSPDELFKEEQAANQRSEHTVLLVEDNAELLLILRKLFAPHYQILVAHNGKEGLELAIGEKPSLIISDVMMPEMTGTEMCIQIKNDIDLCHIPVILLTALNTNEQNIEGLNSGADDYVTKPFNARILLARCNNLIRNRQLLQRQWSEKPASEIDLSNFNPLDKDLLKRAIEIIDAHIDDPQFDIPALCKEIGMGRTLLYAKFKALTGLTPNNFILNHKLKYAGALLLKHPTMQIGEIADRLGFGSAIYFTRCFKNHYNETPQNYRKSQVYDSK